MCMVNYIQWKSSNQIFRIAHSTHWRFIFVALRALPSCIGTTGTRIRVKTPVWGILLQIRAVWISPPKSICNWRCRHANCFANNSLRAFQARVTSWLVVFWIANTFIAVGTAIPFPAVLANATSWTKNFKLKYILSPLS